MELVLNGLISKVKNKTDVENVYDFLYDQGCYYLLELFHDCDYDKKVTSLLLVNHARAKVHFYYISKIIALFEENHIEYAMIKGYLLSKIAYYDIGYRPCSDIDFIIKKEQIEIAKELLQREGYIQGKIINGRIIPYTRRQIIFYSSSTHQIAPFIKKTNSPICPYIVIDLNFDIYWQENMVQYNMDQVFSETCYFSLCGVDFKIFNIEMDFIILCLHHYKDMNSLCMLYKGKFKLNLLSDIYFYIHHQKINIDKLFMLAEKLQAIPYIYYCVYYTKELFSDCSLDEFLRCFCSEDSVKLIDFYGLTDSERKRWEIDFYKRISIDNMGQYLLRFFSESDKEKIRINNIYL